MAAIEDARAQGGFSRRQLWIAYGVIAAVVLAFFVVHRVQAERAHDRLVDSYYCTLSGIGPYDRAPNTGKLCADLN